MWDVIVWKNEKAIDFLPTCWGNSEKTSYKYPLHMPENKIRQYIYSCQDLTCNYKWHEATVKKRNIKSIQIAKDLCEKGEFTSNLDTTDDSDSSVDISHRNRIRRRSKRYLVYEDEGVTSMKKRKTSSSHIPTGEQNSIAQNDQATSNVSDESSDEERDLKVVERKTFKIPDPPRNKIIERNEPIKSPIGKSTEESVIPITDHELQSTVNEDDLNIDGFNSGCSTLTNYSGSNFPSDFMSEVLRNQAAIKFELKKITKQIEKLENSWMYHNKESQTGLLGDTTFISKFPCREIKDLEQVDRIISGDTNKLNELIHFLYLTGGDTVRKTVYAIMKKMLSNELSLTFSGQGKKHKAAFSQLTLSKAVAYATRKRHPQATDDDIRRNISLYLAQTKARINTLTKMNVENFNEPI